MTGSRIPNGGFGFRAMHLQPQALVSDICPLHSATSSEFRRQSVCIYKRGGADGKLKRPRPMTLTTPFVTPVSVWICSNTTSTIVRFASLPPHSVFGTTLLNKGQFNYRLRVVPNFGEK